jgi:hypothetical protein
LRLRQLVLLPKANEQPGELLATAMMAESLKLGKASRQQREYSFRFPP